MLMRALAPEVRLSINLRRCMGESVTSGRLPSASKFRSLNLGAGLLGLRFRRQLENRLPLPLAILRPLESIVEQRQRDMRLSELRRLFHQTLENLPRVIETSLINGDQRQLITNTRISRPRL